MVVDLPPREMQVICRGGTDKVSIPIRGGGLGRNWAGDGWPGFLGSSPALVDQWH